MTNSKGLNALIMVQALVTLGLLVFAYFQPSQDMRTFVAGAVVAHWLNETSQLGRQVYDARQNADAPEVPVTDPIPAVTSGEADPAAATTPDISLTDAPAPAAPVPGASVTTTNLEA